MEADEEGALLRTVSAMLLVIAACGLEPSEPIAGSPTPTADQSTIQRPGPDPPEAEPGREIVDNDWELIGISPEGRVVMVATGYGGAAADCNRFAGTTLDENDDTVEIRTYLSADPAPEACTDELVVESVRVLLDEPLGERELLGCGHSSCEELDRDGLLSPHAGASATHDAGDTVILSRQGTLVALNAATGEERWRHGDGREEPATVTAGAGSVARVTYQDELTVLDATDGRTRWTAPASGGGFFLPNVAFADGSVIYVSPDNQLVAAAATDGATTWRMQLPGDRAFGLDVVNGTVFVLTGHLAGSGPSGPTTITAAAVEDGSVQWSREMDGRPAVLAVTEGVAVVAVGSDADEPEPAQPEPGSGDDVPTRQDGDRRAEDVRTEPADPGTIDPRISIHGIAVDEGSELWSTEEEEFGHPRFTGRGETLLRWYADGSVVLVEPATGAERARLGPDGVVPGSVVPFAETLAHTTPDGHVVVRSAEDASVLWEADVRSVGGPPARVHDLLVVSTPLGAVALADGELVWSWVEGLQDAQAADG